MKTRQKGLIDRGNDLESYYNIRTLPSTYEIPRFFSVKIVCIVSK